MFTIFKDIKTRFIILADNIQEMKITELKSYEMIMSRLDTAEEKINELKEMLKKEKWSD